MDWTQRNVAKEIWVTENDVDEEIENLDAVIEKESIENSDDKHTVETYDFVQNWGFSESLLIYK